MIPSINTKKLTESAKGLFATIKEGFRTNTKNLSEVLQNIEDINERSFERNLSVFEFASYLKNSVKKAEMINNKYNKYNGWYNRNSRPKSV